MDILIKIQSKELSEIIETINFLNSKGILDWSYLSENLPKDIDLKLFLEIYKNKIDYKALSRSKSISWTESLIEKYAHKLDFEVLSNNPTIPLTPALIEKYSELWQWGGKKKGNGHKYSWYELGGLCYNPQFPLNKEFIQRNIESVDFRSLGMNPSICVFNPNEYGDSDFFPCDLDDVLCSFEILIEFTNYWELQGSYFYDGNYGYSGYKDDSIKHNKNIDWDYFNEHLLDYKSIFSYASDYNESQNELDNKYNNYSTEPDDLPF